MLGVAALRRMLGLLMAKLAIPVANSHPNVDPELKSVAQHRAVTVEAALLRQRPLSCRLSPRACRQAPFFPRFSGDHAAHF